MTEKQSLAIVVVAYNRVHSISRLLTSINNANYDYDDVTLIISIDKSKSTEVEDYADSFTWKYGKKIVRKHNSNLGLREHMLSLREWFDYYDSLIVLEDDLVVAPDFYRYAIQTVNKYHNDENVAGISLYSFSLNYQNNNPFIPIKREFDVYFMKIAMSWGQIWMKNSWLAFYEWYKTNLDFNPNPNIPNVLFTWSSKSWLKYHSRYCIECNKYFAYPYNSLTTNCCDLGTHAKYKFSLSQVPLMLGRIDHYRLPEFLSLVPKYDGFYEYEDIAALLKIPREQLCININSNQKNDGKRFLLSSKRYNFKIVKSFGMMYRPIEQNIIKSVPGNDIFLYDTTIREKNNICKRDKSLLFIRYLDEIAFLIIHYGLKNTILDFCEIIFRKLKK